MNKATWMKTAPAALMIVLLLSACAAPPTYQSAQDGGYGYRESQIADNRYRVAFKMRGDSKFEAMDYALLRAAELTLMAGYDWFVVADRQSRPTTTYGAKVGSGKTSESEVVLEVRLGKGVRPTEGDSYDAREVRDNLRNHAK